MTGTKLCVTSAFPASPGTPTATHTGKRGPGFRGTVTSALGPTVSQSVTAWSAAGGRRVTGRLGGRWGGGGVCGRLWPECAGGRRKRPAGEGLEERNTPGPTRCLRPAGCWACPAQEHGAPRMGGRRFSGSFIAFCPDFRPFFLLEGLSQRTFPSSNTKQHEAVGKAEAGRPLARGALGQAALLGPSVRDLGFSFLSTEATPGWL